MLSSLTTAASTTTLKLRMMAKRKIRVAVGESSASPNFLQLSHAHCFHERGERSGGGRSYL